MPYVNKPRPYKHEYAMQKKRDENPERAERQRARRSLDAQGIDRKGKDVSHVKALSSGGSNANGVTLQTPSENRSYKRKSNHKPASALDIPKGKRKIKV
jgi:hypothetical protein